MSHDVTVTLEIDAARLRAWTTWYVLELRTRLGAICGAYTKLAPDAGPGVKAQPGVLTERLLRGHVASILDALGAAGQLAPGLDHAALAAEVASIDLDEHVVRLSLPTITKKLALGWGRLPPPPALPHGETGRDGSLVGLSADGAPGMVDLPPGGAE